MHTQNTPWQCHPVQTSDTVVNDWTLMPWHDQCLVELYNGMHHALVLVMKTTTQHAQTWTGFYETYSEAALQEILVEYTATLLSLSSADRVECCMDIALIASVLQQRAAEVA